MLANGRATGKEHMVKGQGLQALGHIGFAFNDRHFVF